MDTLPLAFDHNDMAVARVRNKSAYTSLPNQLLPPKFTIEDLQRVYEQVTGHALLKSTFGRRSCAQASVGKRGRWVQAAKQGATAHEVA